MLDYEITSVEYDAGRCGPLPEWARVVLAAKWFGATPWDMMGQDDSAFWTEAGLLMRSIEAEANRRASKHD